MKTNKIALLFLISFIFAFIISFSCQGCGAKTLTVTLPEKSEFSKTINIQTFTISSTTAQSSTEPSGYTTSEENISRKKITEAAQATEKPTSTTAHTEQAVTISPNQLKQAGVIYSGGYRYTWYSEKVLPGGGLNIPGRHSDGNFVRDENEYIVLASCDFPKGTIINTPFGAGKVYDYCPTSGTIDVYVSW